MGKKVQGDRPRSVGRACEKKTTSEFLRGQSACRARSVVTCSRIPSNSSLRSAMMAEETRCARDPPPLFGPRVRVVDTAAGEAAEAAIGIEEDRSGRKVLEGLLGPGRDGLHRLGLVGGGIDHLQADLLSWPPENRSRARVGLWACRRRAAFQARSTFQSRSSANSVRPTTTSARACPARRTAGSWKTPSRPITAGARSTAGRAWTRPGATARGAATTPRDAQHQTPWWPSSRTWRFPVGFHPNRTQPRNPNQTPRADLRPRFGAEVVSHACLRRG